MNWIRRRAARPTAQQSRLGWLDALRGIAAFAVVMQHFDILRLVSWGGEVWLRFDFGLYGVMLFFLVSGYIIPASLERRGDVRAFWLGRIFRIHPALIVTIALCVLLLPDAQQPVPLFQGHHVGVKLLANGMMLQDLLNIENGIRVMWTLSYEMVFYFFVSWLYTRGWHRHSGRISVGWAGAAVLIGPSLALQTLTPSLPALLHLVLATGFLVVGGLVFIMTGRASLIRTGAMVLAGVGFALVVLNSRAPGFETFMIFATMFAGTVIYRAEHGQVQRLQAWLCCGFVVLAGLLIGYMYNVGPGAEATWTAGPIAWCNSFGGAWATFGLFMLLRKRRLPRLLTWMGAISFSMYLLHVPVLYAMVGPLKRPTFSDPASTKILWTVEYLAALLVASQLMYTLVEMPMQKLGRKVIKAADRLAPPEDLAVGSAATPAVAPPAPKPESELVAAGRTGS